MARLFTLQIRLGNTAMSSPLDLAAAVEAISEDLQDSWEVDDDSTMSPTEPRPIRDSNGNIVGAWIVEEGPTGSGKDQEAAAVKRWARAGLLNFRSAP